MRSFRGAGSLRERRPGVWEVRVALGPDPVDGRSQRRSLTVHGDQEAAVAARRRWAEQAALQRVRRGLRPGATVEDLLATWLAADHRWRPSTLSGYRSVVRFLTGDQLSARRAAHLSPVVLRAACARWRQAGVARTDDRRAGPLPALGGALGVRRADSALRPLDGMRGPSPTGVRMHAPVEAVRELIAHAEADVSAADSAAGCTGRAGAAASTAGSRLRCAPRRTRRPTRRRSGRRCPHHLAGHLVRGGRADQDQPDPPVTLGAGTARLWRSTVRTWRERAAATGASGTGGFGPWLFSAHPDHAARLTTSCLGHWFADLAHRAGHGDITLHRLRHTVATVLVGRGRPAPSPIPARASRRVHHTADLQPRPATDRRPSRSDLRSALPLTVEQQMAT
jgi:integrase